jgi:hypothetical protein
MKNKSITLLCLVASLFIFNTASAKKVELKQAGQVAINFYLEHSITPLSAKSVSVSENFVVSESLYVMYYVFNFSTTGFVIVSGDDKVTPVLGYSYESNYSDQDQSPEFIYWVGIYKKEILQAITTEYVAPADVNTEWARLLKSTDEFAPEKGIKAVTPLTLSTWDQLGCYNTLCPADVNGPSGHAVTGCVATTMAQVMYYYRYPNTGQSSHSYYSSYGTLSANFGTTTYDYNAMTNVCTSSTPEIAKLIYHAGVSCDMDYSATGSGADMGTAADAMVTYFKYSSNIKHKSKYQYTNSAWETLMKTDLDLGRPIMYSGYDPNNGGHAWVMDGYQGTNFFHFNWGWSGTANGYYYLTALTPTGTGDDFTSGQEAIYSIYPASGYPYYCTGTKNISTPVGTFEDGSGPSNYSNNGDCSWLIAPTGADHISFSFNTLNTEVANDVVTFYDGSTTAAPVLGTYSGSTIPSAIISSSPSVLVKFTTNGSIANTGWQISYYTYFPNYCSGTTVLTALTDTFSDGSGVNNYNNSVTCQWLIQPTNAGSVTLHFTDFNVETTNDKVRVIDPVTSAVLGVFSGTTIPSSVTSTSGQMRVIFQTNGTINDPGWTAYYTSTPLGIEDYTTVKQLSIYPNPANEQIHISFNISDGENATLEMMNFTGQAIYSQFLAGANNYSQDIELSAFAKGIYFLRISTSGDVITKKVVIE